MENNLFMLKKKTKPIVQHFALVLCISHVPHPSVLCHNPSVLWPRWPHNYFLRPWTGPPQPAVPSAYKLGVTSRKTRNLPNPTAPLLGNASDDWRATGEPHLPRQRQSLPSAAPLSTQSTANQAGGAGGEERP